MLALRLIRGSHPLVLLRRLLVAVAAGGVGFLLLSALGYAMEHPGDSNAAVPRLLWCLIPLVATVQLAVSVARMEPGTRQRPGLDAAGIGPAGLPVLAAISTAITCLLGSALALLTFLHLRGDVSGMPFDGSAAGLLAAGQPLPVPAALTLLMLLPGVAAGASALALRSRKHAAPSLAAETPAAPTPTGLPWGAALTAAGLAIETYASRGDGELVPLPGSGGGLALGIMNGWLLTALGLVLAGPGLTHLVGRLLAAGRPGAMRLLAGRLLQEDAQRVGHPLGVLCAVVSGGIAAFHLYGDARLFGPLTALGAAVVLTCAIASVLTAAAESRTARESARAALLRMGAPKSLLRGAAALRLVAVVTALAPLTWLIAKLAALPLTT
ncbi:hypothetical protein [Streptomyces gobiensis]|uniref:hypothetical protein n=1 Tax=Streptomyces gobiensis TaxID=2875706 RepID=UPI001E384B47|nr:hypothetical protein [Streptomyces gobiensis]UGY93851.1 hypothetical protein test1122_20455 [Streptomyces gobiensis]